MNETIAPTVSVIMPAFNAEATIAEGLDSVLAQTFEDWELIVVDDASTDNTAEAARSYAAKDSRVKLLASETNQGVAAARNQGIQAAGGEYLAFLDSDDLWRKEKLEKQVRLMEEQGAVISFTGTAYMNSAGKMSKYVLRAVENFGYDDLLRRNIMSCSSVMVRRDSMVPFPQGYMHEDMAAWLLILKRCGQAYGLDEPLLIYRMGEATKSSNRIKSARMNLGTYREVGYGRVASTILMLRYAIHSISKRLMIQSGWFSDNEVSQ
ncbi:MAG: glycosyltransferase [Defluviitaleaceae bacterium]|nr:glycosyltransferase [Defluviitaleaceae bacterium]